METFEPPKYVAALIASINDGAKSAQAGAITFMAVGLYLVATTISTTDEDLLLDRSTAISQIGVQIPAIFNFAVAPLVFLTLHVFTLIRYDMLRSNLKQLHEDLAAMVPLSADRERCRHLLANVEFVQALNPPESKTDNRLFRWVALSILAIIPIATLVAVQIGSLRYQSETVNWIQRSVLGADLVLLVWFFRGQAPWYRSTAVWISAAVVSANLLWFNVAAPETTTIVREKAAVAALSLEGRPSDRPKVLTDLILNSYYHPIDLLICPALRWGCRYLTVDHKTWLDRVWVPKTATDPKDPSGSRVAAVAAAEGMYLYGRSLRFAKLDDSSLYGANLINADLRGASMAGSHLEGARLAGAQLHGAVLDDARLDGASLRNSHLEGASLQRANLEGVDLSGAFLDGANLQNATLRGAIMSALSARATDFTGAHLQGATLETAHLQGAVFCGAQLDGVSLRVASVWNAVSSASTAVNLVDFRDADFDTKPNASDVAMILTQAAQIADLGRKSDMHKRLQRLQLIPGTTGPCEHVLPHGHASSRMVLISESQQNTEPHFWLVQYAPSTHEMVYAQFLIEYLVGNVAAGRVYATASLVRRLISGTTARISSDGDRRLACRLRERTNDLKSKLSAFETERLMRVSTDCPITESAQGGQ